MSKGEGIDTDTVPINKLKNILIMVDPCIVKDKDTENTWVWIKFGQLWQLDRSEIQKKSGFIPDWVPASQKKNLHE